MVIAPSPIPIQDIEAAGGLVDIGANLGHESFHHDLHQVLKDARTAGVRHIIVTGTSIAGSESAMQLAQAHPGLLSATAGIHPHDASTFNDATLKSLKDMVGEACVVALGETGLDFNRDFSPRPQQEKAFEAQLALACELQMPVFLHERDAHVRFHAILKEYRDHLPRGVVHCFTGDKQALYHYLDLDMHIGITGWICDERRGQHLHPLLKTIPADRLMLETDAPYLLPRNIRPKPGSRRNEPAALPWVLATIAACCEKPPDEIARQTAINAEAFFNIKRAVVSCEDSGIVTPT